MTVITLERAIALATEAHAGQIDRDGAPYILHALRVMIRQTTIECMIVAVCHDVLEDCPGWTAERLAAEGFTSEMIDALKALTKAAGEEYGVFVRRAAHNRMARAVKRADIADNMDLSRLRTVLPEDLARIDKYKRALEVLDEEDHRDDWRKRLDDFAKQPIRFHPQSWAWTLRQNEREEIAQGLHSPKMIWPEE